MSTKVVASCDCGFISQSSSRAAAEYSLRRHSCARALERVAAGRRRLDRLTPGPEAPGQQRVAVTAHDLDPVHPTESTAGWSTATPEPISIVPTRERHEPRPTFAFIDQPWADQALCAETDPELFFPENGGSNRVAKETCTKCFVQAECLDYALTTNERFGVWGGLSERERHALDDHPTEHASGGRP